jgi:hypothetical protein
MYKDYNGAVKNVTTYFILSNNLNSVKLESAERRYFMLHVNKSMKGNQEYFNHFHQVVFANPLFYPTLLSFLVHMPLDDFNPDAEPPKTLLREEMVEAS